MPRVSAVIVAAGEGRRFGRPKALVTLRGRPLLAWSLDVLRAVPAVTECVVVVREETLEEAEALLGGPGRAVIGGSRRQDSVENGARATREDADLVLVHDAARPLVRPAEVAAVLDAADAYGAAVLAIRARDTIKRADAGGFVVETPPRETLWHAQTPQVARRDLLLEGLEAARREGRTVSDDVAVVEALGHPVRLVEGSADNLKITTPGDLPLAEAILVRREEGEA
jgi:2-C-methyl-D-erythritol 4-phosphate cytidylyltransferase